MFNRIKFALLAAATAVVRLFDVNVERVVADFHRMDRKLAKAETQAVARADAVRARREALYDAIDQSYRDQHVANDAVARTARIRGRVKALIA